MTTIQILPIHPLYNKPSQATVGSAGWDVQAAVEKLVAIAPGARVPIPCGFAMALPRGWEAQLRPRSGLALRHGLTLANSPGTIDSDYRGEVTAVLVNHGASVVIIVPGDRIAQLVFARVHEITLELVTELALTPRGAGGFGSTGK